MSYIPASDAGMLNWANNFAEKIGLVVDPTTIGLTADEVALYQALATDYAAKYEAANHPDTRGGSTVLSKNLAKRKLVENSRTFGMAVTRNPSVTNQQRYDFGLTVRDDIPTPVPLPSTAPQMTIVSTVGRTIEMRLRDEDNPDSRARPEGVKGATVMMYVGEEPAENALAWSFLASTSRTSFDVTIPLSVPADSKLWLSAFWYNTKSQSGPVAVAQSTIIRASIVQEAA